MKAYQIVLVTLAAVLVLVLSLTGVYLALHRSQTVVHKATQPAKVQINGSYTVKHVGCNNIDGEYPDLTNGTAVTIKNDRGQQVAITSLYGCTDVPYGYNFNDAVFSFDATVPRSEHYSIEVGDRGVVVFTLAEVQNGSAGITLGQ